MRCERRIKEKVWEKKLKYEKEEKFKKSKEMKIKRM